jgi:hypothetical protein
MLKKSKPYAPIPGDPRSIARCKKALSFCLKYLKESEPRQVHRNTLDLYFGAHSKNLSDWLRRRLLLKFSHYEVGVECKSYLLNTERLSDVVDYIKSVGKRNRSAVSIVDYKLHDFVDFDEELVLYKPELVAGVFQYKEVDNRFYHPLIFLSKSVKSKFWSSVGYNFNYDVSTCAPTLLVQLAIRHGFKKAEPILDFIENKHVYRELVSSITGFDEKQSKDLINAWFNGARLSSHHQCATFRHLQYDEEKMSELKTNEKIVDLRKSIALMWQQIKKARHISCRLNGKIKMNLYFNEERKVMDEICNEVAQQEILFFREHDGFRTNEKADKKKIEEKVLMKTGYKIKLKEEEI